MKKEEVIKYFSRFLKENDIFSSFAIHFNDKKSKEWRKLYYKEELSLKEYLKKHKPIDFLMYAFHWEECGSYDFWNEFNKKWCYRLMGGIFEYD